MKDEEFPCNAEAIGLSVFPPTNSFFENSSFFILRSSLNHLFVCDKHGVTIRTKAVIFF